MQRHPDEFCRYIPAPPGWTLLLLGEDGDIARRIPLTEWLHCRGLHRRFAMPMIQLIPVSTSTPHYGGRYLVELPSGERVSLEGAHKLMDPTWED